MTDAEILAHQWAKHGNPYMPLSVAKEMQRFDRKWAHLGAEVARKRREGKISDPQPCRYTGGTCQTHRREH